MDINRKLYVITICISLVTALAWLFIYNTYENIKTREKALVIEERNIEKLENSLKRKAEPIETYIKEIDNKERKLKKVERDLESEKKILNVKERELNDKETELEDRQAMIIWTIAENEKKSKKKVAYLTFDDGPSENTYKILDILKESNIVATFFVNGHIGYENAYLRIVKEGNKIGNHTYSHDYKKVYSSVEGFNKDVDELNSLLASIGIENSYILRYPGGSNNEVCIQHGGENIMSKIIKEQYDKGYDYFDWNVSSEDATAITVDKETIIKSVKDGCKGKDSVVILFHDSQPKTTTVEALPEIIKHLKNEGYEFRTLEKGCAPWSKFSG